MPKTILFTGGGTLGPVTPLLAVAEECAAMEPDAKFHWIGTRGGPERALVEARKIPFTAITSGKLRRYFSLRNFTDLFRIAIGTVQAYHLLGHLRPDVVVMAGGFVGVPVGWAARLRRIPILVHQQDIRAGLANKLVAPLADRITVTFSKSDADFHGRGLWTGNPVRKFLFSGSKERAVRAFGLDGALPTVLALGGGTGAAGLNKLVQDMIPWLCESGNLLHITGKGKGSRVTADRYHQVEALGEEVADAFAAADIVVTRAGMGVLTELSALGKPAVVMPMPKTHQEENAKYFADADAAVVIDERAIDAARLSVQILKLLGDGTKLAAMSAAMRALSKPDAARRVAAEVLDLATGR
jgi:UDP-N-acetylglucosamine--N-acetylmuramyl-(pentapeptide) pyrophosphoryl-undecaprenol N-acetylglucosamine transferase